MTGAPCLSALAAFRSDAGYVTLAGPEPAMHVFEQRVLEAVKRPLPADEDGLVTEEAAGTVLELAEKAGALAIGPGLGRSEGTKALVRRVLAGGEAAGRRRRRRALGARAVRVACRRAS